MGSSIGSMESTSRCTSSASRASSRPVARARSLVDVAQRAIIGEPIPGYGPTLFGIAGFAPDGRAMVLPGQRGTLLWNLDVASWPEQACRIAGRDLDVSGVEQVLLVVRCPAADLLSDIFEHEDNEMMCLYRIGP